VRTGWSRRERIAALLVTAGYLAELAALRGRAPHQSLRVAFAFAVSWNVLAAFLWAGRALRGGPEAKGFWLGAASFAVLASAHSATALVGRPGLAGSLFPAGEGASTALLMVGVLSWPWRRPEANRGLTGVGATVFTASTVLLLWLLGSWAATRTPDPLLAGVQLGLTIRGAFSTGVVIYLLLEAPGRWRGMLGWAAGAAFAGAVALGFFQRFLVTGHMPNLAGAAPALVPLLLAAGAWVGSPVETSAVEVGSDRRWLQLVFVPFLIFGATLTVAELRYPDDLAWPTIAFVAVAVGVVAVAGLSIQELAGVQRHLEARVMERTGQLEEAMVTLVRNQRISVVATIGAGATHDLKNLLSVIRNQAAVLSEELASGPEAARESVEDLGQAAEQASALVGRIFAYVNDEIEPAAPLDLAAAVRSEQRVLRAVVPRSIGLFVEVPASPVLVRSSSQRVQQILLNLVANASVALGAHGRIVVRVTAGRGPWALEVEDDGPGMPPQILEHLFEPFRTTRGGRGGTGLGLVSVRALAELDGGTVVVHSIPGRGTTVTVEYPGAGPAELDSACRHSSPPTGRSPLI